MRLPVPETNEQVLLAVEEHVLAPARVEEFLLSVERDDSGERKARLEREASDVEEQRIKALVAAIETGGDAASRVARLKELEARRDEVAEQIEATKPLPRVEPEVLESRQAHWRKLLRGSVTQARAVLAKVLDGRLTFAPYPGGLGAGFDARTKFAALFVGVVLTETGPASSEFIEHLGRHRGQGGELLHEEQGRIEASYEQLLRRAEAAARKSEKGVRPWRDSNPRSSP